MNAFIDVRVPCVGSTLDARMHSVRTFRIERSNNVPAGPRFPRGSRKNAGNYIIYSRAIILTWLAAAGEAVCGERTFTGPCFKMGSNKRACTWTQHASYILIREYFNTYNAHLDGAHCILAHWQWNNTAIQSNGQFFLVHLFAYVFAAAIVLDGRLHVNNHDVEEFNISSVQSMYMYVYMSVWACCGGVLQECNNSIEISCLSMHHLRKKVFHQLWKQQPTLIWSNAFDCVKINVSRSHDHLH